MHFLCDQLPQEAKEWLTSNRPRVAFKYGKAIGKSLCNHPGIPKLSVNQIQQLIENKCICDKYSKFWKGDFKHVITADLSFITDINLKELMGKGAKFRPTWPSSNEDIIANIYQSLVEYTKKQVRYQPDFFPHGYLR